MQVLRRVPRFDLLFDQARHQLLHIGRRVRLFLNPRLLKTGVDLVRRWIAALGEDALCLVLLSAGGQGGAGQRDQCYRTQICQPRHQRLR
jgi:hypothetical protein